ncbi:uncharacterized protein LOC113274273 [Papaver somniferum]|uniref:uncharacterized protein LOC113274273 n=1 Tax=Papaver somniferum TaxID=3469 RepID=UPI000E6FE1DE|nr:uncharacterized protein LOC113274273 [Papaver somniferum]
MLNSYRYLTLFLLIHWNQLPSVEGMQGGMISDCYTSPFSRAIVVVFFLQDVDGGKNGPRCSCCCCGGFEDVHRSGDGTNGCGGFEDAVVGDFEDVDGGGNGPNCCDGFVDADGRWK